MLQLPPFRLEHYFAKHEFVARHMISGSDCESSTIGELLELEPGAKEEFLNVRLGYTETLGNPRLRNHIASLYDRISADQVLVHTGAEEPVFIFMNTFLAPGDHVIVQWPCYQSLTDVPRALGCEVTPWTLVKTEGKRWKLDLDFLKDAIQPNTRLVVINSPHNPSGFHFTHEDYRSIHELSVCHGFVLFSDEVYRYAEYREKDRLPAACDINDRAVSLGVMSKSFGLAGLRIGWVATQNDPILKGMASFKHFTTICNSAPSEFLASVALKHRDSIVRRNRQIILSNLEALDSVLSRNPGVFEWLNPDAGPIAFPALAVNMEVEEFCQAALNKAGVLLLPGSVYGVSGPHLRIGFGKRSFLDGLAALESFLKTLN